MLFFFLLFEKFAVLPLRKPSLSGIACSLRRGLLSVALAWAPDAPRFCRARSAARPVRAWADLVCHVLFSAQNEEGAENKTWEMGWLAPVGRWRAPALGAAAFPSFPCSFLPRKPTLN
jgi:hypothetical protein